MAAPNSTNLGGGLPQAGPQGAPVRPGEPLPPQATTEQATASAEQPVIRPLSQRSASRPAEAAGSPAKTVPERPAEEANEDIAGIALKNAPPWLISALVHTIVMILMAILLLPQVLNNQISLETIFADSDTLGEQLEFDSPLAGTDPEKVEKPEISINDLPPVESPLSAPPEVDVTSLFSGQSMVGDAASTNIGHLLMGRDIGSKGALLAAYGGNKTTEAAVAAGLKWLAKHQQKDGSWSLIGPYADGARNENREAATAMALLAFQGAGNTVEYGDYKDAVKRGWYYLLKQQDGDGCFFRDGSNFGHRFYTHGQATIAICELYAMTKDRTLLLAY